MNQQTTLNTEHLIHEALEYSIQHGYTDETYIKGRACVSKAFADRLIELVIKEHQNIGVQWADGVLDLRHYKFVNRRVLDYFGLSTI